MNININRIMTSVFVGGFVLILILEGLGEEWYSYTIAGILTPIAMCGVYISWPKKENTGSK